MTKTEVQAFLDGYRAVGRPVLPCLSAHSIDELKQAAQLAVAEEQWDHGRHYLLELFKRGYNPAETAGFLGRLHVDAAQPQEALRWYRRALALDPSRREDHEHIVFLLDALPDTTDAEATAERRRYFAAHGAAAYATRQPHHNRPEPDRMLRVGYVSGDWNFHSAAIAFASVVMHHTEGRIWPIAYSTLPPDHYDSVTRKTWAGVFCDRFTDVHGLTAKQLAAVIRDDEIDILVDLSGYTLRNRLLTFAYRPAPVQVQAWGYVLGTASPAVDAVLADPIVCPPAMRKGLGTRVVDVPCLLGFHPKEGLPAPGPLPCLTTPPAFVVSQRANKINRETLRVWRQILDRVPEATLTFKGPGYTPVMRCQIVAAFRGCEARLRFMDGQTHPDHLQTLPQFDLALDPWPQTGGVSTLEALWVGLPVLTLCGPRMIARTSASILSNLGFVDAITFSVEDYIDRAVALVTTDRARLAEMRRISRARMQTSPIMTGYVDAVEAAYRTLWHEWCAAQGKAAA